MNLEGHPFYRLFFPSQAVGANTVHLDVFNASGSGYDMLIPTVIPIVDGSVAVVGVVGINLFLTYTSAIGTGGTAAVFNSTALTSTPAIVPMSSDANVLPGGITARITPTGGATAGGVIAYAGVFGEETNSAAYAPPLCMVRRGASDNPAIVCKPGSGIRVVQGGVAATGNVAFDILMQLRPRPM